MCGWPDINDPWKLYDIDTLTESGVCCVVTLKFEQNKSDDAMPGLNQFDLRLLSFSRDFISWEMSVRGKIAGLLQVVVSLSPMMLHLFVMVSCKNLVRPVIVIVRLKIPLLLREYKVCCCRQEFPFPSIYPSCPPLPISRWEAENNSPTHFISGINVRWRCLVESRGWASQWSVMIVHLSWAHMGIMLTLAALSAAT